MHGRMHQIELEYLLLNRHAMAAVARDPGIERSAYLLLRLIDAQGPMTLAQLGEVLGLDVSTVNRQTAAAVRAGLLERRPDPDGGLARRFATTPAGTEAMRRRCASAQSGLAEALDDWTDADVEAFGRYLRRFNTAVERRTGARWPRTDDPGRGPAPATPPG